ncbi:GIY-YIG nuclease family protein [Priestia megaterium]|uniref:GIY-YIG nuclease family protein n=1 Tax=Priestia megaterium TaxID=1404 RepID=UPI0024530CD6|nr:GIY-YIG nuclease family protein [Priestia megaterium]MDH3142447.1 GIY-YIG nuclease family protein [Priestia megaterium]MED4235799.1 GIY-YIG nuclease family protein [Priestia megaterium]MED4255175.1 GIY-YIG nuclease family protein [Priestia megaterium]MED4265478.1 GIY-YIG nuclease family protein [Priestia megaterium]MED4274802.1 GIY-YIG nuclease family protein [Priestia megaterium]
MINYFGVKIKQKPDGLKLTKDNYIKVSNKSSFGNGKVYSDEYIKRQSENSLYNYDLNMDYFRLLPKEEFNKELMKFVDETKVFKEITDLAPLHEVPGYYIMVLDEYAQVYIGSSDNIKKRIQSHWSKQKQFDRLIFGNKENSILSIDSFRAYDTTRIFVYPTHQTLIKENNFINQFNAQYYLNRTKGGALDGLIEAIINRKTRELLDKD